MIYFNFGHIIVGDNGVKISHIDFWYEGFNGLQTHTCYGDETFACDSLGPEEVRRLHCIFEKHLL